MIWCEPSYMKQFHCIADKCSDTCCAGWEIVLDEDAIERYEQTEGSFGKRLLQEIKRDGEREDLIKRHAERIRTAYLSTPVTQKDQPEGGKEERKKETMAEIYSRLFGKK